MEIIVDKKKKTNRDVLTKLPVLYIIALSAKACWKTYRWSLVHAGGDCVRLCIFTGLEILTAVEKRRLGRIEKVQ